MHSPTALDLARHVAACMLVAAGWLGTVQAADKGKEPVSFQHKDWALQCDNTRTCRAVGYQSEGGESEPVSMRA